MKSHALGPSLAIRSSQPIHNSLNKTGRLSKVKNERYSVIQKIGSGEYGRYEVIENIKRLEVWDDK